uniref:Sperm microtubule inner protein 11 n=1 Tax=Crocodylus porosus TaxID=8502 RepID=A0A7M4DZN8_CROPO
MTPDPARTPVRAVQAHVPPAPLGNMQGAPSPWQQNKQQLRAGQLWAQCRPWTELQRVAVAMAFFGLTLLGYQEPFRARRRELASDGKEPAGAGPFLPKLLPLRPGGTVHQGREDMCGQPTRRVQRATPPNQVYRVPLTCGQDVGWWLPRDPVLRPEETMPWMVVPRHPLVRSPVTR